MKDGEHNLKALPYLIAWFDEASKAVLDVGKRSHCHFPDDCSDYGEDSYDYHVKEQKLSAIYQFVKTICQCYLLCLFLIIPKPQSEYPISHEIVQREVVPMDGFNKVASGSNKSRKYSLGRTVCQ